MFVSHPAWSLFSRLGEAQLLLPAMAAGVVWLARTPCSRRLAAAWVAAGFVVALLTTASKVAFIGWEIGSAALDFTGFSGHAMFAALVLPVLARVAVGRARAPGPAVAVGAGYALALAITVSRLVVHAHSASEAWSGCALGAAASGLALARTPAPDATPPRWLLVALLAWMLALPVGGPPSRTQDWVTALSLRLSGRAFPYTRYELHRQAALHRQASAGGRRAPAAQV